MELDPNPQTPPHDPEAELAVIASVLVYGTEAKDEAGSLQESDFFVPAHRDAWHAISQLAARHAPMDPISVGAEVATLGMNRRFEPSWQEWSFAAAQKAQVMQLVGHFAGMIRQMSVLRKMLELCTEVAAKCYARQPVDEVMALAREQVSRLEIYGDENEPKRVGDVLPAALDEIEQRARGEGKSVKSSISTLQKIIGGYKAGQLIVWAARPGEGKTAAVIKEAMGAAVDQGIPALLSSHEMSVQENIERKLGMKAHVEVSRIVNGSLDYSEWRKLQNAAGTISDVPLYIDDRTLPLAKLCATIRRWVSKVVRARATKADDEPIALVVVDYAQLVKVEKSFNAQTREREVACVSRELKLLAKELKVAIILVCQMSRAIEARGGMPQLSDLRESGALEQDADVVIFIHCDAPPEDKKARGKSGPRVLVIAKQRNGKTGLADTNWIAEYMEFVGAAPDEYDGPDMRANCYDGGNA
jgi:replicative DNA helicase